MGYIFKSFTTGVWNSLGVAHLCVLGRHQGEMFDDCYLRNNHGRIPNSLCFKHVQPHRYQNTKERSVRERFNFANDSGLIFTTFLYLGFHNYVFMWLCTGVTFLYCSRWNKNEENGISTKLCVFGYFVCSLACLFVCFYCS